MTYMNKTEALLEVQRLHEAIRLLPEDAKIWSCDLRFDPEADNRHWENQLGGPVEWPAVFDGNHYDGWTEKRICITPFAYGWWSERRNDNDDD